MGADDQPQEDDRIRVKKYGDAKDSADQGRPAGQGRRQDKDVKQDKYRRASLATRSKC